MQVKFYTRNVAGEKRNAANGSQLKISANPNNLPIWAYFTFHGQRLRISTKIKVNVKDWNISKEKIRGESDEVADYNETLSNIKQEANKIFREHLKCHKRLTADILNEKLLPVIFPNEYVQPNQDETLLTFLEDFIENNPKNIKHGTMKAYMQLVPLFHELIKKKGKSFVEFNSVDLSWYEYFTAYLYRTRNHSMNTVAKHVKNVKALMKRALLKELHTNIKFMNMTKSRKDADSIYLTEEEIKKIYEMKIPKRMENSRNLFVFSCLSGLRFSDATNLKKNNWKGDFIEIKTVKTEDQLKIPLRKTARTILEKYDGTFPKTYLGRYNKHIKELGAMVESLNVEEVIFTNKGGQRQEVVKKKYEMIQSHTARRSFATNEYIKGTDILLIRSITGHKTEKDFFRYIRQKQKEKANTLMEIFKERDF